HGGNRRPDDLQRGVAVRVGRLAAGAITVAEEEDQQRDLDGEEDRRREVVDDIEERVDLSTEGGDVLGQPAQHRAVPTSIRPDAACSGARPGTVASDSWWPSWPTSRENSAALSAKAPRVQAA